MWSSPSIVILLTHDYGSFQVSIDIAPSSVPLYSTEPKWMRALFPTGYEKGCDWPPFSSRVRLTRPADEGDLGPTVSGVNVTRRGYVTLNLSYSAIGT